MAQLRRMVALAALVAVAAANGGAGAQQAAVQTFRSGTEVLSIDTSVRDGSGKPVTDLQAADFAVRIDGQPRKVLTSRLYGHDATTPPSSTTPIAAPLSNVERPAGRAVVFVVDRDSIRSGAERALLETAAGMLDRLGPADAAAAASLPGAVTDLTRDHAAVAAAIKRMTGTQPAPPGGHYMTYGEALAYEQHDTVTIQAVVSRECSETQYCPPELAMQAREMVLTGRLRAETLMRNLSSIIEKFGSIRAPKHLVLISAGIPFDQQLIVRYRDLAEKAARAHVSLFVVEVDQRAFDASSVGRGAPAQTSTGESGEGLGNIASITGGQLFHGVGPAAGVFDRIAAAINSFYELGVESQPQDADGKPHKVEVKVTRPGVTVTAPAATAAPPRNTKSGVEMLKAALAEPVDVTELPLAVETYVTHAADPQKVRIIVAPATIDPAEPVPSLWGSVVMDGNKVLGAVGTAVEAQARAPWSSNGSVDVAPGRYHLRTAIIAGNRVGSLEAPIAAGLRAFGDARASDLIVGVVTANRLEPRARVSQSERPIAMLELSSEHALTDLAGSIVLMPADTTTVVARQPLTFRARSDDKGVILGEAHLDLAAIAPGRYTAAAIVEQAGKAIGRVSRSFEVVH